MNWRIISVVDFLTNAIGTLNLKGIYNERIFILTKLLVAA